MHVKKKKRQTKCLTFYMCVRPRPCGPLSSPRIEEEQRLWEMIMGIGIFSLLAGRGPPDLKPPCLGPLSLLP